MGHQEQRGSQWGRAAENKEEPAGGRPSMKRGRRLTEAMCSDRPGSQLQEDKTVLRTYKTLSASEMWQLFVHRLGEARCTILPDCMQKPKNYTIPILTIRYHWIIGWQDHRALIWPFSITPRDLFLEFTDFLSRQNQSWESSLSQNFHITKSICLIFNARWWDMSLTKH